MITGLKDLYLRSPDSVKHLVRLIPFEFRLGKKFRSTLRFLAEADKWDAERIKKYQEQNLARLLDHAIRNVPFYQRYSRLLTKPPFSALRDIEPVSRADVQANIDRLVVPGDIGRIGYVTYTGGTSGHPLKVYHNREAPEIEWAYMIAQWSRVGFRPGDRRAAFRGIEFRNDRDSIVRHNPVYDEILFSPFDLTDSAMYRYVEELKRFRPAFLRGYPSAICVLADFIRYEKITDVHKLKAVLCGSESFTVAQRKRIEETFDCRFYSWYGMTEMVVLAGECESSTKYHAFPQYGITEIEDANGNVRSDTGAEGTIVGTGFINTVMPLIRYKMDDRTRILGTRCDRCGRNSLLLDRVESHRVQDAMIGYSGAPISMTAINMHDDTYESVRQFQFHQQEIGKVTLYLRVNSSFDDERRRLILKSLRRKTRNDIDYDIQIVDRIQTTDIGKGVYLRQDVPNDANPPLRD